MKVSLPLKELGLELRITERFDGKTKCIMGAEIVLQHCLSPATGLMAWGEHIGWDCCDDRMRGSHAAHELSRQNRPVGDR